MAIRNSKHRPEDGPIDSLPNGEEDGQGDPGFIAALKHERQRQEIQNADLRDAWRVRYGGNREPYGPSPTEGIDERLGQLTGISGFVERNRFGLVITTFILLFVFKAKWELYVLVVLLFVL